MNYNQNGASNAPFSELFFGRYWPYRIEGEPLYMIGRFSAGKLNVFPHNSADKWTVFIVGRFWVCCPYLKPHENPAFNQQSLIFQDPAGIFELIEVVGNGTYGQVYKVNSLLLYLIPQRCVISHLIGSQKLTKGLTLFYYLN